MAAVLAAKPIPPIPSRVITAKVSDAGYLTGSIVISESAPPDAQLFKDE